METPMAHRITALIVLLFTTTSAFSDEEQTPTTEALETVLINSIVSEDVVGFAQCWVSAIEVVDMMESMSKVEPKLAEQVPSLKEAIEYHKERNNRIIKLYEGLESVIEDQDLSTDQLSIVFGKARKQEMGKLVRYEVPQIFELRSEDGWVIKIEVDDIVSFGGGFRFFDKPMHAELTLANGERVEVYNSGERGIQWFDKEEAD